MAEQWRIKGDFIDFCRCRLPCPIVGGGGQSDLSNRDVMQL
jgi:hypothetical protein